MSARSRPGPASRHLAMQGSLASSWAAKLLSAWEARLSWVFRSRSTVVALHSRAHAESTMVAQRGTNASEQRRWRSGTRGQVEVFTILLQQNHVQVHGTLMRVTRLNTRAAALEESKCKRLLVVKFLLRVFHSASSSVAAAHTRSTTSAMSSSDMPRPEGR